MKRVLVLGVCALLTAACGGGDDDDDGPVEIASSPLSGKIGGASWTLAGARTNAFLSDDDSFWVDAYGQDSVTCDRSSGQGNALIIAAPKKVGTYRLNLDLNVTFVIDATEPDNLIALQGAIRVDEVTATTLRGGLNVTYDASNTVNGEFTATICAQ